jgi:CheY-like chemotaxis protein
VRVLVEDARYGLHVVRDIPQRSGAVVTTVASAEEAILALKEQPSRRLVD